MADTATIERARAEWTDPATLECRIWTAEEMLDLTRREMPSNGVELPCGRCGHPRWAHADDMMFDGLCICGCVECRGAGYQPGYPLAGTSSG